MALASGTRLGPYEITAQIGVGGMGEAGYRVRVSATNLTDGSRAASRYPTVHS